MAGQVVATKSVHLMCGSKLWTLVAFGSCLYFARVAFVRTHSSLPIAWSHDTLDIITHLVWIAFMFGLLTETRCWKERVFFVLVLLNFALAFTMGLWRDAPDVTVAMTRRASSALWALATVVSLVMIFLPGDKTAPRRSE